MKYRHKPMIAEELLTQALILTEAARDACEQQSENLLYKDGITKTRDALEELQILRQSEREGWRYASELEEQLKLLNAEHTEGYKLVPIEPTEDMLAAACNDGVSVNGRPVWKQPYKFQAKWKYQQMLDAAPEFNLEKNHEPDLFTNTKDKTFLGILKEGEYFSFLDSQEIYEVLKQTEQSTLIQGVEFTANFTLPKTVKVQRWVMLH